MATQILGVEAIQTLRAENPSYRLREVDQTAPAGMWQMDAQAGNLLFQAATAADWSAFTTVITLTSAPSITIHGTVVFSANVRLDDDIVVLFGDDSDYYLGYSATDDALEIGTGATIASNVIIKLTGGGTPTLEFPAASTISTGAGDLTLDPAGDIDANSNDIVDIGGVGSQLAANAWTLVGTDEQVILVEATGANPALLKLDGDRVAEDHAVGQLRFQWDGNRIAQVAGLAGPDTTGKLDGKLLFSTSPPGGGGVETGIEIDENQRVLVPTGITIGADSPNNKLDDGPNGSSSTPMYIGTEIITVTTSDVRLKTAWSEPQSLARDHLFVLSKALEEYNYVPGFLGGARFIGFGAQHLDDMLPQYVVHGVGDNTWSVHYQYMVGPLIWGWQDHEKRITQLEVKDRVADAEPSRGLSQESKDMFLRAAQQMGARPLNAIPAWVDIEEAP